MGRAVQGDTLWVVAEHGLKANYVRNIRSDPRVRVRLGRRWRAGTAHVLPDDDWRERQRRMPNRLNSGMVRAMGSQPVTCGWTWSPASRGAAVRRWAEAPAAGASRGRPPSAAPR